MRFLVVSIFLFLGMVNGISQVDSVKVKKKNYPAISANFQPGKIMPTTPFVRGDNLMRKPLTEYHAYAMKMLWQNPGYSKWQQVFKAPYYGFGVTMNNFFNHDEIGLPISTYGILGFPIKRWRKLELYAECQYGLTWGWKHYVPVINPKNEVVGGSITVHVNGGINAFYPINDHLDLGFGLSFIHFSNGGFERPNKGFNIYAPSVELKYHINGRPNIINMPNPEKKKTSHELLLMLGYGDHQLVEHPLDTNYFAIGGLSAIHLTQFSNAFRLGFGGDFNYWWGLNANDDGTPNKPNWENLTVGLILQPEITVGKLTLVSGYGIYARHRNYGNFKQTYQRLGVRYDFYKNMSFGVNVRAINFTLAEFMEFNLAYRIKYKRTEE